MPFIQCGVCGGSGTRQVQKARLKDGKMVTETVTEDCSNCRGSGVIPK